MFGLQPWHLMAIVGLALIVFGPSRLPEIGRAIGQALQEFRGAAAGAQAEFKQDLAAVPDSQSDPASHDVQPKP